MGRPQFHGLASDIMIRVPALVKRAAEFAFHLRDTYGFVGANETGWKRAKQLVSKDYISIEDLQFMRNWYARHVYTSYPGYKQWINLGRPTDKPAKRSIISWLTWGGDAGLRWINSSKVIKLLNKRFSTSYGRVQPN